MFPSPPSTLKGRASCRMNAKFGLHHRWPETTFSPAQPFVGQTSAHNVLVSQQKGAELTTSTVDTSGVVSCRFNHCPVLGPYLTKPKIYGQAIGNHISGWTALPWNRIPNQIPTVDYTLPYVFHPVTEPRTYAYISAAISPPLLPLPTTSTQLAWD